MPATTAPFAIWIQVTDGNGAVPMQVMIEHLPDDNPEPVLIVPVPFTMTFSNPLQVLEYVAEMVDGIFLEHAGLYRLGLLAYGQPIAHRDFIVQLP